MIKRTYLLSTLFVILAGCAAKEVKYAPLGDVAPEFGKGAEHGTLQGFLTGRWCLVEGLGGVNPNFYYEFRNDGSFTCGETDSDWNAAGRFAVTGDQATLTYETMKGKSWQVFIDEYKKDEQGGGQVSVQRAVFYDQLFSQLGRMTTLWVDEDKKHLTFSKPTPVDALPPSSEEEGASVGDMMSQMGGQLERMGPKKD